MFYASGNWDSDVFDRPEVFDLSRKPNPHLGFGGGGRHFCLGAHVARTQLRAIFGELLHQLPDHCRRRTGLPGRQFRARYPVDAVHVLLSSPANRVNISEQPASTLTVAWSSPRVGPRLMIPTGMLCAIACRTKR